MAGFSGIQRCSEIVEGNGGSTPDDGDGYVIVRDDALRRAKESETRRVSARLLVSISEHVYSILCCKGRMAVHRSHHRRNFSIVHLRRGN
jgi:hypothetical protein